MRIPQKYRLTKKISIYLAKIEANKDVIAQINVPVAVEENVRAESILGSALFSARIEGNTLTRGEIGSFSELSSRDKRKLEVANILRAIKSILADSSRIKKITEKNILAMHRATTINILAREFSGRYRAGHEGVFDSAGNLIYHSPPPSQVRGLMGQLVDYINSNRESRIPIRAVLTHLGLVDIHPFVDGSGRVGRLLQTAVLAYHGYGMKGLISPEELIEANRRDYYRTIEYSREDKDATDFVELMLEFLAESSTKAKDNLLNKQRSNSQLDLLLPRRKEIVQIISEQKIVSLDFLHRRFLKINPRLLSYDLKCLMDAGFIVKIGKTRGALYTVAKS